MRSTIADVSLFWTAASGRPWSADPGPVLLGLHGGPGIDGSHLRYMLAPMQEWATVVVPDQRGHGRSSVSAPEHWTLTRWAEDVRLLIEGAGLEDVILVGVSFGGFVVQRFLADHPGVVRGGVVAGASPRRAGADEIVARYADVGGEEAARVMRRSLTDHSPEAEREWARVCGPLSRRRPPDDVLAAIQRDRITSPEVNRHFMATFADLDLRADLARVRDPILVLVGEHDPLTPPRVAAEIGEYATGATTTMHVVDDAAHQVFWDAPGRCDGLLCEFADALGLTAPAAPAEEVHP